MARRDGKSQYTRSLPGSSLPPEEDYSLEEILAEYGTSREQKILKDVERETEPSLPPDVLPPETPPVPTAPPEPSPPAEAEKVLPPEPQPISLEEVVGSTVGAVLEERNAPPRRGLFSRRRQPETEEFYETFSGEKPQRKAVPREVIEPEPALEDALADCREDWRSGRGRVPWAFLIALLPTALLAVEWHGIAIPLWTGEIAVQCTVLLACLLGESLLCGSVFSNGWKMLREKRCVSDLLVAISVLLSAADCVMWLLFPGRSPVMPYAAANCWALAFARWGEARERRGMYDTLRTAALDEEPPYLVTETPQGAAKQPGAVSGFYTTAMRPDSAVRWQSVFLPLVLAASLVFAVLSSFGQGRDGDFLLNWSVILTAGATFSLPLCWGLPFSVLAARLQRTGCAVAGWDGAERISRQRKMILKDSDLFPPGTVRLNGVKVYGETAEKAASYAAAITRAADSGLARFFDGLVLDEEARQERAEDFSFYEEGGYSAAIRGESVLLGTASFMRKMGIRLPNSVNLRTGIFLALDGQLAAIFAVKYDASKNVEYALRMTRRSRILPILATRDPNITPVLLKRKFYGGVRVDYPDLTTRVALGEVQEERGLPRALLLREGLLPYAETVAGSRRLCGTVRRAVALSLCGSAAGTLLTFYLASLAAYGLLTPLSLTAFLLLWAVPVLLLTDWTRRC